MLCLAEPVGDMPGGCSYLLSCVNSEEERGKLSSLSLKAKSSVAAGRQPAAELGVPARGHLQSAAREQEASKASQRACGAAVWSELFPPPSALGGQAGLGGGGRLGVQAVPSPCWGAPGSCWLGEVVSPIPAWGRMGGVTLSALALCHEKGRVGAKRVPRLALFTPGG